MQYMVLEVGLDWSEATNESCFLSIFVKQRWCALVKEVATMLKVDLMGGNCLSHLFSSTRIAYLDYITIIEQLFKENIMGHSHYIFV